MATLNYLGPFSLTNFNQHAMVKQGATEQNVIENAMFTVTCLLIFVEATGP